MSSEFDSKGYYCLSNDKYPGNWLSSGSQRNVNGEINMTTQLTLSSQNWQLYYQSGRYFIRNYDYLGDWQLGLDENEMSIPRLMRRSGALGQQWVLARDGDQWTFANAMLGNRSWLAMMEGNTVPAMQPSPVGHKWVILTNPSAKQLSPPAGNMIEDVKNLEVG